MKNSISRTDIGGEIEGKSPNQTQLKKGEMKLKRMECGSNIGNQTTENASLMVSLGLHSTHGRERERDRRIGGIASPISIGVADQLCGCTGLI